MIDGLIDRMQAFREGAPTIPVSVPEWSLDAFARPISAAKHSSLRKNYGESESRMAAQLIIHGLVDDKGVQVFTDDVKSMAEIERQPSGLVLRIAGAIMDAMNVEMTVPDAKN